MQLSAPIFTLKRKAKALARASGLALHQALDQIAVQEGFRSWSHLAASSKYHSPAKDLLSILKAGDLGLIGARPGQGKTLLGLGLAYLANRTGRQGYFFTLDYHERDVGDRLSSLGLKQDRDGDAMVVDTSDDVSAAYIIERLNNGRQPALVVVDYLQLLDQKRSNPSLDTQIASLRAFVSGTQNICVIISQIDRSFDLGDKPMPDASDIRMPNPVTLSAFDTFIFLHDGKIQVDQAA